MNWIKLSINTLTEGIEALCGKLYSIGITGLEIEDSNDFNDFLENSRQYWDYVDDELMSRSSSPTFVRVYITDNATGHEQYTAIKQALAELKESDSDGIFGTLEITSDSIREQDWAENWKQYYKPLTVGEKILIVPEWETAENTDGKVVFTINPGMSFGTGTHQSTQLCIESLEKHIKPGDSVLDLGCGSGILSIISMLLEADHALAIDIDPNAAKIARENAEKNNIDPQKYQTAAGNILTDGSVKELVAREQYDIILANIVADVIIGLCGDAKKALKQGGVFITSGIILERIDDVVSALENTGFEIINIAKKGEWASITAK